MTQLPRRRIQSFSIPIMGKPIVWARTTTTPEGKRVTANRYRAWKKHAREVLRAGAGYRTFRGEVAVDIELHYDRVTVAVQALDDERRRGTGLSGDVDNYAKAVLDALQAGGVLDDDRAVAQLTIRIHPSVEADDDDVREATVRRGWRDPPSRREQPATDEADDDDVREATASLTDRYQSTFEELA